MFITPDDLAPFAIIDATKAAAMIADGEAMAILAAPCLPGLITAPDGETEADAAVRQARGKFQAPACGAGNDAAQALGTQQAAVLSLLPAQPNERLVYHCAAGASTPSAAAATP